MMNVINNNNSHYQLESSCDQINMNTFAEQPLSSVFDCNSGNSNLMNNNMNNNMNKSSDNSMNMFDASQNRLLLKQIRNRNTRDFKELVSSFWMPNQQGQNQQQALKNSLSNGSLSRRTPSTDAFGNFHPIDISANKNKNEFGNGKPNATMDMRIPLGNASSVFPNSLSINKNLFRPNPVLSDMNVSNNNNNMMPLMSQSMSNMNSQRVSMTGSASVISDDSNHSQKLRKPSTTAIINAATNIVSGNELDGMFHMSNNMQGMHQMEPMPTNQPNQVSEPGPYDIVCGRNSGAYNYIGNRRFRVTIEMNLQRYIDSPTREDKTNVIKSIVWMLHEQVGARFLKKETCKKSSGSGSRRRGVARYTIMTDKQAREKVGHALRDLVITARKEAQEKNKKQKQPESAPNTTGLQ